MRVVWPDERCKTKSIWVARVGGVILLAAGARCWLFDAGSRRLHVAVACSPQAPTARRRPSSRGTRAARARARPGAKSRPMQREAPNAVTEARRTAPPAPAFVPGLVRPEAVDIDELKAEGALLVDKGSDIEEAVRWITEGGRALVVGHWRDLERCRAAVLKPLKRAPANAKEAEKQRTLKKQLSDRLLGRVVQGRIALQGAPRADFLLTL